MSKIELALQVLGALYALCSVLANALPIGSKTQVFFARVALSLRALPVAKAARK